MGDAVPVAAAAAAIVLVAASSPAPAAATAARRPRPTHPSDDATRSCRAQRRRRAARSACCCRRPATGGRPRPLAAAGVRAGRAARSTTPAGCNGQHVVPVAAGRGRRPGDGRQRARRAAGAGPGRRHRRAGVVPGRAGAARHRSAPTTCVDLLADDDGHRRCRATPTTATSSAPIAVRRAARPRRSAEAIAETGRPRRRRSSTPTTTTGAASPTTLHDELAVAGQRREVASSPLRPDRRPTSTPPPARCWPTTRRHRRHRRAGQPAADVLAALARARRRPDADADLRDRRHAAPTTWSTRIGTAARAAVGRHPGHLAVRRPASAHRGSRTPSPPPRRASPTCYAAYAYDCTNLIALAAQAAGSRRPGDAIRGAAGRREPGGVALPRLPGLRRASCGDGRNIDLDGASGRIELRDERRRRVRHATTCSGSTPPARRPATVRQIDASRSR